MSRIPILQMPWLFLLLLGAAFAAPSFAGDDAELARRKPQADRDKEAETAEARARALAGKLEILLPVSDQSADAPKIWRALVELGPEGIPGILAAMEENKPVLCNYLR